MYYLTAAGDGNPMAAISIAQTTIKSMKKKRTGYFGVMPLKRAIHTIFGGWLLLFSTGIFAQDMDKKISVEFKNTPLWEACTSIEKQTGFNFSYSENTLLAYGKNITLSLSDV